MVDERGTVKKIGQHITQLQAHHATRREEISEQAAQHYAAAEASAAKAREQESHA